MTDPIAAPKPLLHKLAVPIAFAVVLLAAALGQDRLTLGVLLFICTGLSVNIIRALATREAPLRITGSTDDQRQKLLVMLVGAGMWWLPMIAIATPFLDFAAYRLPVWMVLIGALLAVPGLWLFWRSHADLGRNWSVALELRDGHRLVTEGVYRRIRHPMYSAIFLQCLAQPLFIQNWIAGPAGLIAFGILYLVRVGPEERMMEAEFGADWRAYLSRSGRLWPRV